MLKLKNPIAALTSDKQEQKNVVLNGSKTILRTAYLPMMGGDVAAPFNASIGMTPTVMAAWGIPGQILTFVMVFVSAAFGDRVTNRIKTYTLLSLCNGLAGIAALIFLLGPERFRTLTMVMAINTIVGLLAIAANSFYATVDATVECRIMHNEIRGRSWSIFGIISGIVGMLVGVYTTFILAKGGMRFGYAICSATGILLVCISAMLVWNLKELPSLQTVQVKKQPSILASLKEIAGLKQFWTLMPANFLRGVGNGFGGYLMLLAFQRIDMPPEYAGYSAIIASGAIFVGYIIIGLTMDRFGAQWVLPIAEVLMSIGIMGTILANKPLLFLGALLLYRVMENVEASGVPLVHYEVVPREVMGAFSAVRLGLLSVTGSFSTLIIGFLLDWTNPVYVFAGCCVTKLLAGAMYSYGVFSVKRHMKAEAAKNA